MGIEMDTSSKIISERYSFLTPQMEKEAHVYEMLNEISRHQDQFLKKKEGMFATMTDLQNSRI
jgi:hypothetical protein